jgi:hypothetical protein
MNWKTKRQPQKIWCKIASKLAGFKKRECDIPPLNCHNDIIYDDSDKAEVFKEIKLWTV